MKNKKIKFLSSFAFLSTMSVLTVISCSNQKENQTYKSTKPGYRNGIDFGIAVPQVNSLNYIKNKNLDSLLPTLVEGLIKEGPSANDVFGNLLGLPVVQFQIYSSSKNDANNNQEILNNQSKISNSGRSINFSNLGLTTGVVSLTSDSIASFKALSTNSGNNYMSFVATLNGGASKWSNGEPVKAQDFIDSLLYILDNNTGSQKMVEALNLNIKNSKAIVDIQNDYVKQFGINYSNPFGRKGFIKDDSTGKYIENFQEEVYKSEREGDQELVNKMKTIASQLGLYTGRVFNEFSNQEIRNIVNELPDKNANFSAESKSIFKRQGNEVVEIKLTKNPFLDPKQEFEGKLLEPKHKFFAKNEYDLRLEFEESAPKSFWDIVSMSGGGVLVPINRKFVETQANGINNFGSKLDKFLWNGAFDITNLVLGPQGNMLLEKRKEYYSSDKTIANKAKVFFADQPELLSALFSEGYIAATKIPATYQKKFWSALETRRYMEKTSGYGTIALQFNLDPVKNGKSYIQDEDLRKAIYYAINRESLLKLTGWDSSFAVNTWTAFGQAKTNRGINLETFFDGEMFTTDYQENGENVSLPVQSLDYKTHIGKSFKFEAVDRKDPAYNIKIANHYLNKFKAKYPNLKNVNLQYIYTGNEGLKAAIGVQDLIKRNLGGFINIELKGYPSSVFHSKISSGEFDLSYQNFDKFGTNSYSYISTFFSKDGIIPNDNKTIGYELNPSGGWTYKEWWDSKNESQKQEILNRLNIENFYRNKFEDLITRKIKLDENNNPMSRELRVDIDKNSPLAKDFNNNPVKEWIYEESQTEYNQRIQAFFNGVLTKEEVAEGWDSFKIYKLVLVFEKIIREAAPIIPLMEVDTNWIISRLGGSNKGIYRYSLQFSYDFNNPPRANLPKTNK